MCIVDRTIIRNIWKLRMGLCSMQERASREGVLPVPSVYPCGEKTPTMSGGSVMCIVDRTIIRNIWKLRMGLCSMQERASREGVRMPITQSGWATVKLGIDLGGVLSKA